MTLSLNHCVFFFIKLVIYIYIDHCELELMAFMKQRAYIKLKKLIKPRVLWIG